MYECVNCHVEDFNPTKDWVCYPTVYKEHNWLCDICAVSTVWDRHLRSKSSSTSKSSRKYLLTFTKKPEVPTQIWANRIISQLDRSNIHNFISGALEHITTNIHCHAYVESPRISKDDYRAFSRNYGFVDVRQIKVDNGIEDYTQKELGTSDKQRLIQFLGNMKLGAY